METKEYECKCGKSCSRQALDDKAIRILTRMSEGSYTVECDCNGSGCCEEKEKEDG